MQARPKFSPGQHRRATWVYRGQFERNQLERRRVHSLASSRAGARGRARAGRESQEVRREPHVEFMS